MNENTIYGAVRQQIHVAVMLRFAYDVANFIPPNNRVADIGSGFNSIAEFCWNAEIYLQRYQIIQEFTAIDCDDRALADIRKGLTVQGIPAEHYRFIHADARRLESIIAGQFGLTIVRHPQLEENHSGNKHPELYNVWKEIFEKCRKKMHDNGLFIATHFCSIGFAYISKLLRKHGYKLLFADENPYKGCYFRMKDTEACCFDKYLVVARK